ncbi:MAG: succinate dehydrogenase, hydrophobic membrane anchor protein [Xanthomonadales bacterium]|nr:succinate dehydrogenase, hydrophobic membrane anchor protein [Xanthomonadales bacterium]NIN73806.1 succinate dehydrogenase, hydrophobic membrane anchor protein [Xanthomonadales bacterium]NIP10910.1 succinate dehydrogenase, hydrophobic membrane anchor protein [Xanthomonadales bacterium]NIT07214.1 succinate dehydrogenase, hydrophobic membrane anchor protein [Xanthomonadales bacterium]NIT32690.1 succinate dehydrogenase, hydrophobic membrane anchor protein [Xanthomonadales bacterium]
MNQTSHAATHHGGLGHWLWQRVSSLVLIPLTLWVLWAGVQLAGAEHAEAAALLGHPGHALMALLFTGVMFFHAQSGIQVICEDYVYPPWFQSALIWLTRVACFAGFVVSAFAIGRLALGA